MISTYMLIAVAIIFVVALVVIYFVSGHSSNITIEERDDEDVLFVGGPSGPGQLHTIPKGSDAWSIDGHILFVRGRKWVLLGRGVYEIVTFFYPEGLSEDDHFLKVLEYRGIPYEVIDS